MKRVDYTGQRFGRLIVLSMTVIEAKSWCECVCDCGEQKLVVHHSLRNGVTKSCGCLASERIFAANLKHGESVRDAHTVEWQTWRGMRARCETPSNTSYPDYGGRGIKVCERWQEFENFLVDMGRRPSPDHSIDRFPDNDGDYEPGNTRWATRSEQAKNRRERPRVAGRFAGAAHP